LSTPLVLAALSGCGTVAEIVGSGLEKAGLKQPASLSEAKAMVPLTKDVTLRIHAGEGLNVDPDARPLSVVVRIYRLGSAEAFARAPLSAFKDAHSEKAAFGDEILAVREVVLTPRQKYEVVESLPQSVKFVGIVALFRAPSQDRWRFVFDKEAAARTGITMGAHACALSVSIGQPILVAPELARLAGARCG
jgi:type VI secretion system protein VasD